MQIMFIRPTFLISKLRSKYLPEDVLVTIDEMSSTMAFGTDSGAALFTSCVIPGKFLNLSVFQSSDGCPTPCVVGLLWGNSNRPTWQGRDPLLVQMLLLGFCWYLRGEQVSLWDCLLDQPFNPGFQFWTRLPHHTGSTGPPSVLVAPFLSHQYPLCLRTQALHHTGSLAVFSPCPSSLWASARSGFHLGPCHWMDAGTLRAPAWQLSNEIYFAE